MGTLHLTITEEQVERLSFTLEVEEAEQDDTDLGEIKGKSSDNIQIK